MEATPPVFRPSTHMEGHAETGATAGLRKAPKKERCAVGFHDDARRECPLGREEGDVVSSFAWIPGCYRGDFFRPTQQEEQQRQPSSLGPGDRLPVETFKIARGSTVSASCHHPQDQLPARILKSLEDLAVEKTSRPLAHIRCCLVALTIILALQAVAYCEGGLPGRSVIGLHVFSTASSLAVLLCSTPLALFGVRGSCVKLGCLGSALTCTFALAASDLVILCAYLMLAMPRPLRTHSVALLDQLEASVGVWQCALFASPPLEMATTACLWRIYRELRRAGLYPPEGGAGKALGRKGPRDVSVLEVLCELEDAEALGNCDPSCDPSCDRGAHHPLLAVVLEDDCCESERRDEPVIVAVGSEEPMPVSLNSRDVESLSSAGLY